MIDNKTLFFTECEDDTNDTLVIEEVIVFGTKLIDVRATNGDELITHILLTKNKAIELALTLFKWGEGELD
ncbi:hypothetical protein CIRMBP1279_01789 [Enterococcus cecorum]|uniref:hypothetical protein n=1 Tax=Enterococcus cecorum TaxID=44008 RepID=UPI0006586A26|nr:hypothetical protein [Enterococcus cecorum]KLO68170.1 hypothetical protein AA985_00205 [Enterococcus cecorum]CAI3427341.1 hypothetical protein CIRMBP1280_01877 [Enterococcus cecorum]CAI3430670.1 hypothetical protein CIRMBP1214_01906 [Enterococcus cecorum]CAI3432172.1 hypothetical protein CIRMBP1279_01789 [Enterococcus cecorum]CAI3434057.1 hypothetical protein CIRMBP1238_01860 [Enterococcus cecorum]